MLTISEEILLLMLDDETGWLSVALPGDRIRAAIGGAVLMDLALVDRVDTDLDHLFLVSPDPVGEPVLDHALKRIAAEGERRSVDHWVDAFTNGHEAVRSLIDDRLVARGVVSRDRYNRLLVMGGHHLVDADGHPYRHVRRRLAGELMNEEIPDPRDIMIISLVDTCMLWPGLIDEFRYELLAPRIRQIARLDLIGQAVARVVSRKLAGLNMDVGNTLSR